MVLGYYELARGLIADIFAGTTGKIYFCCNGSQNRKLDKNRGGMARARGVSVLSEIAMGPDQQEAFSAKYGGSSTDDLSFIQGTCLVVFRSHQQTESPPWRQVSLVDWALLAPSGHLLLKHLRLQRHFSSSQTNYFMR